MKATKLVIGASLLIALAAVPTASADDYSLRQCAEDLTTEDSGGACDDSQGGASAAPNQAAECVFSVTGTIPTDPLRECVNDAP